MERRRSTRYRVFTDSEIISGNKRYEGVIGNISENGVYIRIKSVDARINFTPESICALKFELPSEETITLRSRLVYAYEIPLVTSQGKFAYNLGLEIIDPLPEFIKLYEAAVVKKLNDQIKSFS
ncbi:MAG: PilZ domain-containing protein [Nitrospirae bacterium]|nr:PilZ domain-containing protein [Nitrospirota bacterium]